MAAYQSKGSSIAKARENGYIPGLAPAAASTSSIPGLAYFSSCGLYLFIPPPTSFDNIHPSSIPGLAPSSSLPLVPAASNSKAKKKKKSPATATTANLEKAMSKVEIRLCQKFLFQIRSSHFISVRPRSKIPQPQLTHQRS